MRREEPNPTIVFYFGDFDVFIVGVNILELFTTLKGIVKIFIVVIVFGIILPLINLSSDPLSEGAATKHEDRRHSEI